MTDLADKGLLGLASEPLVVREDAEVKVAAQLMQRSHVGSLVVVDEDDQPLGLITDRDVALGVLRRPPGSSAGTVSRLTSRPLITLPATSSMDDATRCFGERCIRRIGLTDESGGLIGVLSSDAVLMHLGGLLHDLTDAIGREFELEARPLDSNRSVFGSE